MGSNEHSQLTNVFVCLFGIVMLVFFYMITRALCEIPYIIEHINEPYVHHHR